MTAASETTGGGRRTGAASRVAAELVAAYRASQYCVTDVPEPFMLTVDAYCDALRACHADHGATCSAFLTACNPESQPLPEELNAVAQMALRRELDNRRMRYLDGLGIDPSGEWPAEPSLLVLGISLDAACEIGARYRQNALVWCAEDAVPRLVLLR